jgi:pimeloyl-ACP methyl ester carboxylesterase
MRDDPALARDLLQATARPGPSRGYYYYYQLLSSIGWTSLPRVPRLPTLILAGDDDPIIPLINARIMHRLMPRSEFVIYHGGHLGLARRRTAWRRSWTRSSPPKEAQSDIGRQHAARESLGTDFFSVREQFTDEQWSHFVRPGEQEVTPWGL